MSIGVAFDTKRNYEYLLFCQNKLKKMGLCVYTLDVTNEIGDYQNVPDFHVDTTSGSRRIKYRCPFSARTNGDFCEFHDQNISAADKSQMLQPLLDRALNNNEPLVCIGFNLPNLRLLHKEFKNKVYFNHAHFYISTQFINVTFSDVYFIHASFKSNTRNYWHVQFNGVADFNHADFQTSLYFLSKSSFNNLAKFSYTTFRDQVSFRNVSFSGKTYFAKAHFMRQADFAMAKFNDVSFNNVNFDDEVEFAYVTFDQTDFIYCTFKDLSSFFQAQFIGPSKFHHVTFIGKTIFDEAKLTNVIYDESEFNEVSYIKSIFPALSELLFDWYDSPGNIQQRLGDFIAPYIKEELINIQIPFLSGNEIRLSSENNPTLLVCKLGMGSRVDIYLNGTKLPMRISAVRKLNHLYIYKVNRINKEVTNIPVRFDHCTFRDKVRLVGEPGEKLDLSLVSFRGVDLSNFEFHNVEFLRTKMRRVVIDEKFLKQNNNFEEVSRIYNQLRKNYEDILAFNEASNFFIGEMDVTRRYLASSSTKGKVSSIGYFLYKIVSLYGESAFLPLLIWTPALIFIFTLLRFDHGICSTMKDGSCLVADYFFDSLAAFFQIPRSTETFDIVERIVSAPILGSAFIAVRRMFERKK